MYFTGKELVDHPAQDSSLIAGVAVKTKHVFAWAAPPVYFPTRTIDARLELTDQGMVRYALKSAYLRGPIGMGLLGGNPTRCV